MLLEWLRMGQPINEAVRGIFVPALERHLSDDYPRRGRHRPSTKRRNIYLVALCRLLEEHFADENAVNHAAAFARDEGVKRYTAQTALRDAHRYRKEANSLVAAGVARLRASGCPESNLHLFLRRMIEGCVRLELAAKTRGTSRRVIA